MTNLVFSYTRAQALEDGVLVDVTALAHEVGFRLPVAFTLAAWERYVCRDKPSRSHEVNVWEILLSLRDELIAQGQFGAPADRRELEFVSLKPLSEEFTYQQRRLVMNVGPGDDEKPVVTIMLPGES